MLSLLLITLTKQATDTKLVSVSNLLAYDLNLASLKYSYIVRKEILYNDGTEDKDFGQ